MKKMGSTLVALTLVSTTLVAAHTASASSEFVMSGYQQLSSGLGFTEIATEFQVPPAPVTFSSSFAIWPGLQSNSHVIQPVLKYFDSCEGGDNGPCPQWIMQNEVEPGGLFGRSVAVNAGDWILAEVWLDNSNPGSSCNPFSGANCNYLVGWVDLSNSSLTDTGLSQSGKTDFMFTDAPSTAYGLILETGNSVPATYNTCSNFPAQGVLGETEMFQATFSSTGLYTPVASDLVLGIPGLTPGYTDQSLTSGGTVFTKCGFGMGVGTVSTDVGLLEMGI